MIRKIKVTDTPNDLLPKKQLKWFKNKFKAAFPDAPKNMMINKVAKVNNEKKSYVTTFKTFQKLDKIEDLAKTTQSEQALEKAASAIAELTERFGAIQ